MMKVVFFIWNLMSQTICCSVKLEMKFRIPNFHFYARTTYLWMKCYESFNKMISMTRRRTLWLTQSTSALWLMTHMWGLVWLNTSAREACFDQSYCKRSKPNREIRKVIVNIVDFFFNKMNSNFSLCESQSKVNEG